MAKRQKLTTTITEARGGGYDVVWRGNDDQVVGAIPIRVQATAELLKELLDRGVPPADAIFRAFRPKRKPRIDMSPEIASKYGRIAAKARNAALTPERRKEIAERAALARWGAK